MYWLSLLSQQHYLFWQCCWSAAQQKCPLTLLPYKVEIFFQCFVSRQVKRKIYRQATTTLSHLDRQSNNPLVNLLSQWRLFVELTINNLLLLLFLFVYVWAVALSCIHSGFWGFFIFFKVFRSITSPRRDSLPRQDPGSIRVLLFGCFMADSHDRLATAGIFRLVACIIF